MASKTIHLHVKMCTIEPVIFWLPLHNSILPALGGRDGLGGRKGALGLEGVSGLPGLGGKGGT